MRLKICVFMLLALATFSVRATVFQLNVATVDTAYAHYVNALVVVDSDNAHISELGARPAQPTTAVASSDWNTYVTSLNTYNSSLLTYQDSLNVHTASLRTAELAVLAALGLNTGYTNICCGIWVEVQGNSFTTAWIGFYCNSTSLTIHYSSPSNPFPNY